jgi:hypothetical protein
MKIHRIILHSIAAIVMLTVFASCEKNEKEHPMTDVMAMEALTETYLDEAFADADHGFMVAQQGSFGNQQHGPGQGGGVSGQRIITVEQVEGESEFEGFPKLITIEFIEWETFSGRTKNGFIYIWTNGPLRAQGAMRVITFDDYTIDANLIEGTKTIFNQDATSFSVTLEGCKITFSDGTFITREMERQREWIAGMDTPFNIWDDEFLITGFTSGTNRDGLEYSHTITQALHKMMNCRWFVAGTIEMQAGDNIVILDYGDGDCDNQATITVNGESWQITLPMGPRPGGN